MENSFNGIIIDGKVYEAVPRGICDCYDCDCCEQCFGEPLKYDVLCSGLSIRNKVMFRYSKELTEKIKYRKAQSSWINVKKQLPQSIGWYLVRYAKGYDSPFHGEALWNNGFQSYNNYDSEDITHWMPIPSFDDILEANKDVLKRLKEEGD